MHVIAMHQICLSIIITNSNYSVQDTKTNVGVYTTRIIMYKISIAHIYNIIAQCPGHSTKP